VLREGPVPVTELRAGIIVGAGSAAYEVIRDLVNHLPLLVTPRWVNSRSSPLALGNLLTYLVELPRHEAAAGQIYDAGGPEYLSYETMMRRFGALVGRRPRIVPVPVLTPGLSALWLALITTVPASIARALIGGLKHDIPAHDAALRALVPQTLLGFDDAVRAALQAERDHAVAARWTEGRLMFRGNRLDHAFYAKRAGGSATSSASPQSLWQVVWHRWRRAPYLERLGGCAKGSMVVWRPGHRVGAIRRSSGDTIDCRTVIGSPRRLTLNWHEVRALACSSSRSTRWPRDATG
jgi:hypothetical protein